MPNDFLSIKAIILNEGQLVALRHRKRWLQTYYDECVIFRAITCLNIIALQLSICDVRLNLLGNSFLVRQWCWRRLRARLCSRRVARRCGRGGAPLRIGGLTYQSTNKKQADNHSYDNPHSFLLWWRRLSHRWWWRLIVLLLWIVRWR